MGRSFFLRILFISALLLVCFSQGFGRNLSVMRLEGDDSTTVPAKELSEKVREMFEVLDYSDPEPNTNPRNGNLFTPPAPTGPAPPPEVSD